MESASSASARIAVKGGSFVVDTSDKEVVCQQRWFLSLSKNGRKYVRNASGSLARFLMRAPKGMHVDHINGDTLDNRRCNLRVCTHAQNQWNRKRAPGRSRLKGATYSSAGSGGRHWMARCEKHGKGHFRGWFATALEAALAYDAAAVELFGEYASPNFPERFRNAS